jgi:uncharacterized coiled-coil DUF342 family protein
VTPVKEETLELRHQVAALQAEAARLNEQMTKAHAAITGTLAAIDQLSKALNDYAANVRPSVVTH